MDWKPDPVFSGQGANFSCATANALLMQIRKLDIDAGGDQLAHYYGMVFDGGNDVTDAQGIAQWMRGCASVIPSKPDPSAVASGPTGTHQPHPTPNIAWKRMPTYGDWYAAHEIGHTFGRSHVGTSCGDEPPDDNYPIKDPIGLIADKAHQFIAFDGGDPNLNIPMQVLPSKSTYDSMTYCPGEWLGGYNYLGICSDLNGENHRSCGQQVAQNGPPSSSASATMQAGAAQGPAPNAAPGPAAAQLPYLALTGSINYTRNTATFQVVPTTTAPPSGPPPATNTIVELRNAQGGLIATYPVVESYSTDIPRGADQTGNISAIFPFSLDIKEVIVKRNGATVAILGSGSQPSSVKTPIATTPSIKDQVTNLGVYSKTAQAGIGHINQQSGKIVYSWGSGPPDPDTKYNVQVSIDGSRWRTVAVNLGQSTIDIDPTWIAGATTARLRVIAVNGIHHDIVTSDDLNLAKP